MAIENLKRGLASLFQMQLSSGTTNEVLTNIMKNPESYLSVELPKLFVLISICRNLVNKLLFRKGELGALVSFTHGTNRHLY